MSYTVKQRGKKKKWYFRVFDKKGTLIATASGFRTKKEAEKEALQIDLKALAGLKINSSASLYELWKEWFEVVVQPMGKDEATLYKHQKRGDLINKFFGDTPATKIRFSQYQRKLNQYAEKVTKDTVQRLNAEVRKVIQFAKRDGLDIKDFTEGAIISGKRLSKTAAEKHIDNIADYYKIVRYLRSQLDYSKSVIPYYLYISFKTGMRFGEVLGLTWDCVLWSEKAIHTYRRYDSSKYSWRPPKTVTSDREVPIDNEVIAVLKKLQKEQKQVLSDYHIDNPEGFLFYDKTFGVPTNNAINKQLRQILQDNSVRPYNLSTTGIRHTYASILLAKDIDIWIVANVMGHKDIKQVTQTYGHLLKEKRDKGHEQIRHLLSE